MKTAIALLTGLSFLALAVRAEEGRDLEIAPKFGVKFLMSKRDVMEKYPMLKCLPPERLREIRYTHCEAQGIAFLDEPASSTHFTFQEDQLIGISAEWANLREEPKEVARKIGAQIASYVGKSPEIRPVSVDDYEPSVLTESTFWRDLPTEYIAIYYCPRKTVARCAGKSVFMMLLRQP
jgi:hypothetical protein